MLNIVADATIIIETLVSGEYVQYAESVILADESAEINVVTPQFALLEGANVLWKYAVRGLLTSREGITLLDRLLSLPLTIAPVEDVLKQAFNIAARNKLAVYDSIYIALAQQLDAPLYTLDARQADAARSLNIDVRTPF